jgi:hypothetical protein
MRSPEGPCLSNSGWPLVPPRNKRSNGILLRSVMHVSSVPWVCNCWRSILTVPCTIICQTFSSFFILLRVHSSYFTAFMQQRWLREWVQQVFDRHACTYTVSTCHDSQMQSKSGAAEFPDSLYRIDGLKDFLVHFGQKIAYSSCKLNWVIDCVT